MPDPSEDEIATLAGMTREQLYEWARERGIRLATPAMRKIGCTACRDGDNIRHPGQPGQPWRCESCPVDRLRQALRAPGSA